MKQSVLFSKDRFDDDFLSSLFNSEISREQILKFRLAWLQACKARGISEVWLTADGANSNCEIDSPLSQHGKAQSLKHIPVVSYILNFLRFLTLNGVEGFSLRNYSQSTYSE